MKMRWKWVNRALSVTVSGLSFGLRRKWSAMSMARAMFFSEIAFVNSKLLKSLLIPMLSSMCCAVIRFVPSGRKVSSLASSLEMREMSVPRWSVSIPSALGSIVHPFDWTKSPSQAVIS